MNLSLKRNLLVKHLALKDKDRWGEGNNPRAETASSHARTEASIPFKAWKHGSHQ